MRPVRSDFDASTRHAPVHEPYAALRRAPGARRALRRLRRLGDAGAVHRHHRRASGGARSAPACSTSATWARSSCAARTRSRRAQELTVNDLGRLRDGQAQYSLLCRPTGGVVDDIMVHRVSSERVLLCVNAVEHGEGLRVDLRSIATAPRSSIAAPSSPCWRCRVRVRRRSSRGSPRCRCRRSPRSRSPRARSAVARHWSRTPATPARTAGRSTARRAMRARCGTHCSRRASRFDIRPAGLGARDTLRLERALPLYGHELTDETTPLEAGLSWVVRFTKPSFIGRDALAAAAGARFDPPSRWSGDDRSPVFHGKDTALCTTASSSAR